MLERRLRIYFGYFPTWQVALLALGLLWLLLGLRVAPFGILPEADQVKFHRIFVEVLGVDRPALEGLAKAGIFLCALPMPLGMALWGGYSLWLYWQYRLGKEEEGDLLIGQALAHLPRRVIERMGLPEDMMRYEVLILWGPHPEDRVFALPMQPIHEKLKSVMGRMRVGKDGLGRFARYDVLIVLRDEKHLYLKDGFYDITKRKFFGELTGDYRLGDLSRVLEDAGNARLALRFQDGWQYEVNLLSSREARRVFSPFQVPLLAYEDALKATTEFVMGEGVPAVRMLALGNQRMFTQEDRTHFQEMLAEQLSILREKLSVRYILPGSVWFSIEVSDLENAQKIWKIILNPGEQSDILRTEFSPRRPLHAPVEAWISLVEEQLEHQQQNRTALERMKQRLVAGQTDVRKEITQQEEFLSVLIHEKEEELAALKKLAEVNQSQPRISPQPESPQTKLTPIQPATGEQTGQDSDPTPDVSEIY